MLSHHMTRAGWVFVAKLYWEKQVVGPGTPTLPPSLLLWAQTGEDIGADPSGAQKDKT